MQHLMPTKSPLHYAVMFLETARVSFVFSSFMQFLALLAALHSPTMLVLEQPAKCQQIHNRFVLPCQYIMVLKQLLSLFFWSATLLANNISEIRGETNIIPVWVKRARKNDWMGLVFSLNTNGWMVMSSAPSKPFESNETWTRTTKLA